MTTLETTGSAWVGDVIFSCPKKPCPSSFPAGLVTSKKLSKARESVPVASIFATIEIFERSRVLRSITAWQSMHESLAPGWLGVL